MLVFQNEFFNTLNPLVRQETILNESSKEIYLTFICPYIANIFSVYNQKDSTLLKFIYVCKMLYMFQTVFTSIIRSTKLHIQCQAFVIPLLLPAEALVSLCMCSFALLMMDGKPVLNM